MNGHNDLERYRDAAMDFLARCYAQDLLTMDDYERRIELVGSAGTDAEIRDVLFDLRRAGPPPDYRPQQPGSPVTGPGGTFGVPESNVETDDTRIITLLSSRSVSGNWLHKQFATAVSVMGTTVIDMTDEALPTEVQLHVVALMGEVKIYVPLSANIQNTISPVLGEVKEKTKRDFLPSSGRGVQRLRLTGVALMGEVRIIRR